MGLLSIGAKQKNSEEGLRPLLPSRDLAGVADLIEEAFAKEMDSAGRKALKEMRWLAQWKIFLRMIDFFSPDVNTYLNGFVWVEAGKIVGNTTISRGANDRKRWFVSNVAVSKEYRGRRISRYMMDAAIQFVKEMRGREISLQVRKGNEPAINLYRSLGFRYISATTNLSLAKIENVEKVALPAPFKIRGRRFTFTETQAIYQLALATVSPAAQRERPLQIRQFQVSADFQIDNAFRALLGFGIKKRWIVEERKTGQLVAVVDITPALWRGNHKLSFLVHPHRRGQLEKALISQALAYLKKLPKRKIEIQHADDHQAGVNALVAFGFSVERTLMWMTLSV